MKKINMYTYFVCNIEIIYTPYGQIAIVQFPFELCKTRENDLLNKSK